MFFTRTFLNPARRHAVKLLSSPQAMHAAVLASFPPADQLAHDAGRVLWRIDSGPQRRTELFIVSPTKPDLTHIHEQAGWPTRASWDCAAYEPFLNSLQPNQTWAFRLHANVTKYVRFANETRGKPVGLIREEHQRQWLISRSENLGVHLLSDDGKPTFMMNHIQKKSFTRNRHENQVALNVITYEGILQVADPQQLRTALISGIGRARGYGCGLLTLAKPR